jgi:hypothetical protein
MREGNVKGRDLMILLFWLLFLVAVLVASATGRAPWS